MKNSPFYSSSPRQGFLAILGYTLLTIVLIVVLLAVGGIYYIQSAAPTLLADYLKTNTGFNLKAEKFDLNIFAGRLEIKNATLDNPDTFPTPTFIQLDSAVVRVDLASLIRQPYHIKELSVAIKEVNMVTNAQRENNAKLLTDRLNAIAKAQPQNANAQAASQRQDPNPAIKIDQLNLSLQTVRLVDGSRGGTPRETTIPINFTFSRQNVTDMELLRTEITQEAMATGLRNGASIVILRNIAPTALLQNSTEVITDTVGTGVDTAAQGVGKAANTIKDAASSLRSIFGRPSSTPEALPQTTPTP